MSMMDVAKYLSYSRSIDLKAEKDRYFNLSRMGRGSLCECLQEQRGASAQDSGIEDRSGQHLGKGE